MSIAIDADAKPCIVCGDPTTDGLGIDKRVIPVCTGECLSTYADFVTGVEAGEIDPQDYDEYLAVLDREQRDKFEGDYGL